MLSWKKLAKFAMAGGLAFGLITGTGTIQAKAEKPTVEVDYYEQSLVVVVNPTKGKDKDGKEIVTAAAEDARYIYVAVTTGTKAPTTWERIETELIDSHWIPIRKDGALQYSEGGSLITDEIAGVTGLVLDISAYTNPTKEYTVHVKTDIDPDSVTEVKLAKQTKGVKASFDKSKNKVVVKFDNAEQAAKDYEWNLLYGGKGGSGLDLEEELDKLQIFGATIMVRQPAKDFVSPASKEVKVKIPKKPNGPKVTVNPSKLVLTIPAGVDYRVVGNAARVDGEAGGTLGSYNWTATQKEGKETGKNGAEITVYSLDKEWISNSSKATKKISEIQALIDPKAKIEVTELVPKVNSDEATKAEKPYIGKDGKPVANIEDADLEEEIVEVTPDILAHGASIEFKTVATAKKAESKISYVEIPVQNPAPVAGKDFEIDTNLNRTQDGVTNVVFKNISNKKLEVAVVQKADTYDISTAGFTAINPGATKNYGTKAAPNGNVFLVRTAAVNKTARTEMVLGGAYTVNVISYPVKPAGLSSSDVSFKEKTGEEKTTILTLKNVTDGKAYAYKIGDSKIEDLKLKEKLPDGYQEIKLAESGETVVDISGVEAKKYITVYEYDPSTKVISKFISHELTESEIGKKAATEVVLEPGSKGTPANESITGLTDGKTYIIKKSDGKYYAVLSSGTVDATGQANQNDVTNTQALSGVTSISGLINGESYLVIEITAA